MMKLKMLAIAVLCAGSVHALPLYNPIVASLFEDPCCEQACDPCGGWSDQWSWGVGFVSTLSANHKMSIENSVGDYARVKQTQLVTAMGELTLNFGHRFELFGQLGALWFYQGLANDVIGITDTGTTGLVSDTDFAWALGGRATLLEWGPWGFGAEAEYLQSRPNLNTIGNNYPDLQLIYREWQIGFGISYHVCKWSNFEFVPYFGARVGGTQIDADRARVPTQPDGTVPAVLGNEKQERRWGTAVGITALSHHRSFLNFEWDFLNDNSAVINFNIGF